MKIIISERQLKLILGKEEDVEEQIDPAAAQPEAGTSSSGEKEGYPEVSTWSDIVGSKLTRGPANQIAVTKWSDTVGANLNRGPANQLK